jgi:hypothetical protein
MKKIYWRIIIGIISCLAICLLLTRCNFSYLNKLSPKAIVTMLLLALLSITTEFIYLNMLLKASSLFTGVINTVLIYCSSYIISTFTTYYIGVASYIIILKKTAKTTYKRAFSNSLTDMFIRYSLRAAFAFIGIVLLFGSKYIWILAAGVIAIMLACVLLKNIIMKIFLKIPYASYMTRYYPEMINSLSDFPKKKLAILFFIALAHLFMESIVFFYILKQFGYEYTLLIILSIRNLGLFIGYLSFFATFSIVEDLGVVGLWVFSGMDPSAAFLAVAINRILLTIIPAIISIAISSCFFTGNGKQVGAMHISNKPNSKT